MRAGCFAQPGQWSWLHREQPSLLSAQRSPHGNSSQRQENAQQEAGRARKSREKEAKNQVLQLSLRLMCTLDAQSKLTFFI